MRRRSPGGAEDASSPLFVSRVVVLFIVKVNQWFLDLTRVSVAYRLLLKEEVHPHHRSLGLQVPAVETGLLFQCSIRTWQWVINPSLCIQVLANCHPLFPWLPHRSEFSRCIPPQESSHPSEYPVP